jgi:GH15 family glucan-1,4-alpha-glucosidase
MSRPETSSGAVPSLVPGAPGRYRAIGDYAFLGDCHSGALVSSAGSVDWLCLPRLDDGSYCWTATRAAIRATVERHGYDPGRGVFTQAFDRPELDAALLLLPAVGFVAWDDPRMLRTVNAVRAELEEDGLLLRYRAPDGLEGIEGAFVACSFWLAECLARQGRTAEARAAFTRASATANDLGLFAEEFDQATGTLLGNFPQALTHLSHITAAVALEQPG